jgi:ABC-type Mn2+/Zn2+ transport system ATPase subunit
MSEDRLAIDVADLRVAYDGRPVLDDVTFSLAAGSSAAVMGPNGSGKTTLLRALVGSLTAAAGRIHVDGRVAYVLQNRSGRTWLPLTVGEVITMGRYGERGLLGRLTATDRTLIRDAAERMEMTDLLSSQFGELSGGQQQRALLAQALAQQPTVLLLDEPITGLDLPSQQRILDLIDEETERGTTVVLTTHNLDEARHCDSVLLLAGTLIAIGPPDQVLTAPNLRLAFGDRLLGDHHGHDHASTLLMIDDHGHSH